MAVTCKTSFFCYGFFPWQVSYSNVDVGTGDFCVRKEHKGSAASRRLLCQCCCPVVPGLDPLQTGTPPLSPTAVKLSGCSVPTPAPFSHCQIPCRASVFLVARQEPLGRWSCSSQQASLPGQHHLATGLGCWAIPATGDSEAGALQGPWHNPALNHCLQTLPSSPFLPPSPQGPNSQLCCSINIITIIILSLDT